MKAYIVETADLHKNLQNLIHRADGTPIWAVLKGNGYGLGLIPMATICRENGVNRFAVTEIADVRALRESGFADAEILMLRPTCSGDDLRELLALNATITVSSSDDATVLNGVAAQLGVIANVHLKIDTGMGRYGFLPTEIDKILPIYAYMDSIAVSGIYTHLHSAFCNKNQTMQQAETFRSVISAINTAGYETGMAHIANSAAFLRFPELKMDGVRLGSALLGRLSFKGSYALKRIGCCKASVDELRWIPKGHTCGYGAGWKARRPTRIAVLPIGWYNGFGCEMGHDIFRFRDGVREVLSGLRTMLGHKAIYVTINDRRCRVLGHIGMLHTVCDVTDVPCALGDTATLNINPLMLKDVEVIFK